jgi:acetylcholinesterase
VIAGSTESEGTSWAESDSFGSHQLNNNSHYLTKTELKNQIDLLFNKTSEAFAEKIYDYYISHIDEKYQILLRKAYIAIFTDSVIKCPTFYFGKKLTQFSSGNKVYFYEFTYNSKLSECRKTEWKGICHGDDIAFVFGHPIENRSIFSESDYEFSLLVEKLWTDFAKYGYN